MCHFMKLKIWDFKENYNESIDLGRMDICMNFFLISENDSSIYFSIICFDKIHKWFIQHSKLFKNFKVEVYILIKFYSCNFSCIFILFFIHQNSWTPLFFLMIYLCILLEYKRTLSLPEQVLRSRDSGMEITAGASAWIGKPEL